MNHMGRQRSLRKHLVLLLVRLEICGDEGRNERQQLILLRPSDRTTPGKQTDKQSRQHCSDICCNAIGVLLYVPRGVHSSNTTAVTSAANQKLLAWACAWRADRCGFEEEAMLVALHEDTKVIPSEFR
ncbi:unnamed protein product [Sphagnum balticum]